MLLIITITNIKRVQMNVLEVSNSKQERYECKRDSTYEKTRQSNNSSILVKKKKVYNNIH